MSLMIRFFVVFCVVFHLEMQTTPAPALKLLEQSEEPLLRVIPRPDPEFLPGSSPRTVLNTLINYNSSDHTSVERWTRKIDKFLEPYGFCGTLEDHPEYSNRVHCDWLNSQLTNKQICDVPVKDFHPCTESNQYNFNEAAPCVFLKLDDILNWQPKLYNTSILIPEEMSEDLKFHIRFLSGRPEANTVWVSCEGENPADVENIGPVQYIPRRGFPSYYYPFTNKEGYLSPLVAVLFEKPRKGVVINVECKAWARNSSLGATHFKLLVY